MTRSIKLFWVSLAILQIASGLHATVYIAYAGFFFREKYGLPMADVSILVSAALMVYGLGSFWPVSCWIWEFD